MLGLFLLWKGLAAAASPVIASFLARMKYPDFLLAAGSYSLTPTQYEFRNRAVIYEKKNAGLREDFILFECPGNIAIV